MRYNGEQLKEMRDLEPKYFLLTQYLLVAEMLYSFLPTLKIQNFREAAICRQKTYTKTRTFFRCCYLLAFHLHYYLSIGFHCPLVKYILPNFGELKTR